jgi:hypothetical protein
LALSASALKQLKHTIVNNKRKEMLSAFKSVYNLEVKGIDAKTCAQRRKC